MKAPRFEALAQRYRGRADFFYVFSDEAHPRAASSARLNEFADALWKMDANGDGRVGARRVSRTGVQEHDASWNLFEALGLHATPAFVLLSSTGHVERAIEGAQPTQTFLRFLGR